MIGALTVYTGPMFSGKSDILIRSYQNTPNAHLIKPAFDTRFDPDKVISRTGISAHAHVLQEWVPLNPDIRHVFFDETNFFVSPMFKDDIVHIIQGLLLKGVNISVSGLDKDWKGIPFETTSKLCGIADEVFKLHAYCSVCREPACHTFKKQANDTLYELGDNDLYEARCSKHWHNHNTTDFHPNLFAP